jgi:hypothetical protein
MIALGTVLSMTNYLMQVKIEIDLLPHTSSSSVSNVVGFFLIVKRLFPARIKST